MNLLLSDPAFLSVAATVSGGGGGSGYDPDAQAYITAVEAADTAAGSLGGLETAVKDAINAFVVGCKADGIWTAIVGSCILAGARTIPGCLIPLKGVAPTQFGSQPDPATYYDRKTGLTGFNFQLFTGYTANGFPQDSVHMSCYVTTFGGVYYMGTSGTSITAGALHLVDGRHRMRSGTIEGGSLVTPSLRGLSRASLSGYDSLLNGTVTPFTRAAETLALNRGLGVFGTCNDANVIDRTSPSKIAFYSVGTALSLSALNTRVNALLAAFAAAIP